MHMSKKDITRHLYAENLLPVGVMNAKKKHSVKKNKERNQEANKDKIKWKKNRSIARDSKHFGRIFEEPSASAMDYHLKKRDSGNTGRKKEYIHPNSRRKAAKKQEAAAVKKDKSTFREMKAREKLAKKNAKKVRQQARNEVGAVIVAESLSKLEEKQMYQRESLLECKDLFCGLGMEDTELLLTESNYDEDYFEEKEISQYDLYDDSSSEPQVSQTQTQEEIPKIALNQDEDIDSFTTFMGLFTSPEIIGFKNTLDDLISIDFSGQTFDDFLSLASLGAFFYQLYKSRSKSEYAVATLQFLLANRVPISNIYNLRDDFLATCGDVAVPLEKIQTESWSERVDIINNYLNTFSTSAMVIAMRDMIFGLVSLKIFSRDVKNQITEYTGKPPSLTKIGAVSYILTGISNLFKFQEQLEKGVTVHDALLADDPVTSVMSAIQDLLVYGERTNTGLAINGYMNRNDFITKGTALMSSGKLVHTSMSKTDGRKSQLKALLETLNFAVSDLARACREMRTPPLGLVLYGPPCVGKSILLKHILSIWSRLKGRVHSDALMYSRCKTSDYLEGYVPHAHPYMHYSELGNMSTNRALADGDPFITELNSLIDSLPYNVDMAFGEKGKVYACPEVVGVDTNNKNMHVSINAYCPSAIMRRFLYIEAEVLPEFRVQGSCALDAKKSFAAGKPYINRYKFKVSIYEPIDIRSEPREKILLTTCDVTEFTIFLKDYFTEFMDKGERAKEIGTEDVLSMAFANQVDTDILDDVFDDVKVPEDVLVAQSAHTVSEDDAWWRRWVHRTGEAMYGNVLLVKDTVFATGKKLGVSTFEVFMCVFMIGLTKGVHLIMPEIKYKPLINVAPPRFLLCWIFFVCGMGPLSFLAYFNPMSIIYHFSVRFTRNKMFSFITYNHWNMDRLRYLCGKGKLVLTSKKGILQIGITIGIIAALLKVFDRLRRKSIKTETNTFVEPVIHSNSNHAFNEMFESGSSFKRVKTKLSPAWNVMKGVSNASLHRGPPDELYPKIFSNVRRCWVVRGVGSALRKSETFLLGICGSYAVINAHAFQNMLDGIVNISTSLSRDVNDVYKSYKLSSQDIVKLGSDRYLINLKGQQFTNIIKHFNPTGDWPSFGGGFFFNRPVRVNKGEGEITITDAHVPDFTVAKYFTYEYSGHRSGMCGLPLVYQQDGGSVVAGIHVAGSSKTTLGYSVAITGSELLDGVSQLDKKNPYLLLHSQSMQIINQTKTPLPKSPFSYEHYPMLDYYGRTGDKVLMNKKSSLQAKKVEGLLDVLYTAYNFFPTTHYDKPVMSPFSKKNGEYISPYNIALRGMNKTPPPMDSFVISKVVGILTSHIIEGLNREGVHKLSPLTFKCAINGAPSDDYIGRINASTSAGYGFTGAKKEYLPFVDESDPLEIRCMSEELQDKLASSIHTYLRGDSCGFVYASQLKDEPRELSKVIAGKTRVFFMSSLDNLILARAFLAPFYSLMVEHNDLFCTAIGINMHVGADTLLRKLETFSEFCMEGDYKAYDQSMPIEVASATSRVVCNVLESLGYNEQSMCMVRGLLTDACFPVVEMNTDVFIKPGLTPSGKYATAEDNSLKGLFLLMYSWYANPDLTDLDFFEYVKPVTYGDDMLAAVKPSVVRHFNNCTYARDCEEYFGIVYTAARKNEDLKEYMSPKDTSFLKRLFVWSSRRNMYIAPLDMNSIYKSLTWFIPSAHVTEENQTISTMASALWELYFHSEESEPFEMARNYFLDHLVETFGGNPLEYDELLPFYSVIDDRILGLEEAKALVKLGEITTQSLVVGTSNSAVPLNGKDGYLASFGQFLPLKKTDNLKPRIGFVASACGFQWQAENLGEEKFGGNFDEPESSMPMSNQLRFYETQLKDVEMELNESKLPDSGYTWYQLQRSPMLRSFHHVEKGYMARRHLLQRQADLAATISFIGRLIERETTSHQIRTESNVMGEQKSGIPDGNVIDVVGNITDVGGEQTDIQSAGRSKNSEQGQRNLLELDDFFNRPIEIANFPVAAGTDISAKWDVWDLYTLNPTVRSKLRNYAYLRGDLVVRVATSGTPFHSGKFMSGYEPYPLKNDTLVTHLANLAIVGASYRPLFLGYLSQAPGSVTIDVRENQPVDIRCPFISTKPMHRLYNSSSVVISDVTSFNDLSDAGSLYFYSINQIKSVSATPSNVYVQVYAWMENVELGCPTATQVAITTESNTVDERETGPVERMSSGAAQISSALSAVPWLAPMAMASSMLFKGISGVASIFGWSRPVMVSNPVFVKNRPFTNGAQTIGAETSKRLTLDPKQELTVDPRCCGVETDDMVISEIMSRVSYLTTFSWNDTDGVLANSIFKCKVNPGLEYRVTHALLDYVQPTALAYASMPFLYWRGDITFRFEIVCSAFHRGKLAFFFDPNVAQYAIIDSDLSSNKNYMKIIDIQQTQVVEFCVKWAYPRAWAKTVPLGFTQATWQSFIPTSIIDASNGFIGVVPFTALQSPDNSDISVNVYVYSDNMMVNQLGASLPSSRLVAESNIVTESNSSVEVPCYVLNDSSAVSDSICVEHFGERPVSFRALLKRYVTTSLPAVVAAAASADLVLKCVEPIVTYPQPVYGSTYVDPSLFGYLRYAFLGLKGGMRKRVRVRMGVSETARSNQVLVKLRAPSSGAGSTQAWGASEPARTNSGTLSYGPSTNCGVEFELPFYTSNLFVFSCADDLIGIWSDENDMSRIYSKSYEAHFEFNGSLSAANQFVEESATAEDFSMMRFQGAPYYTI